MPMTPGYRHGIECSLLLETLPNLTFTPLPPPPTPHRVYARSV